MTRKGFLRAPQNTPVPVSQTGTFSAPTQDTSPACIFSLKTDPPALKLCTPPICSMPDRAVQVSAPNSKKKSAPEGKKMIFFFAPRQKDRHC